MEISKTLNGNELVIGLKGRLDTTTAPELEKELTLDNIDSLVLDFKSLDYISSAGLRAILNAQKKMSNKKMVVKNVSEEIKEIFEMTGFDSILTIE